MTLHEVSAMAEQSKPETPRERLFRLHTEMSQRSKALMKAKNGDYASDEDPLANFRRHGLLGMAVRLDDKMARLNNFVKRGVLNVVDESLDDTLCDIINYAVLFSYYTQEEKRRVD